MKGRGWHVRPLIPDARPLLDPVCALCLPLRLCGSIGFNRPRGGDGDGDGSGGGWEVGGMGEGRGGEEREGDDEGAASADGTLDGDGAAVRLGDLPRDGETEARAAVVPPAGEGAAAIEAVEEVRQP